ncbi:GNAT family N-acetyltransferase [Pseudomonas serboccidentalis]|uniref:GNAT family N-acetyltransferase n=1 Tax=Pseudomonas serboccidentalis TaxID=2964670 RepID=A0ABY7Z701_9PSED|nr:GNAT family N-acetyltransferase [Pseudomonas serboccidentalis]WDR35150.1 GNAT family N-acetyltransferase [Pseudomonas serboccidentalis]
MSFVVRRARHSDAAALPAIERSAAELFRVDPALAWLADAPVPDAEQHLQAVRSALVWVTEHTDQQLGGFLRAVQVDNQLHVEELSVSQHFQGQGMGRKLLLMAIEYAAERQLRAVTLTTFSDLPWNAPFYQRIGFSLLTPQETPAHLLDALNSEAAHGLPIERRCAMHLELKPQP